MILMVHTEVGCKEYRLPCLYNSGFSAVLSKDSLGFSEDITIYLETVENVWRFSNNSTYMVLRKNYPYFEQQLQNGDILEFLSECGERASIIVCEREQGFKSFQKYDVSRFSQITIGKSSENTVVYDFYGLVSRTHGLLYRKQKEWFIKDCSVNGIFCRWKRIKEKQKISFGEKYSIFGLEFILLGNVLCVNAIKPMRIDTELPEFQWKEVKNTFIWKEAETRERYYHRSPRILSVFEKETIMLEFPTLEEEKHQEKNKLFWNLRKNWLLWKQSNETEQKQQVVQVTHTYLKKQILYIKEKYQQNQRILRETYPSATVCCEYDKNSSALWNRNFSHKDILFLRLGLGKSPFKMNIEMPERIVSLQSREQARLIMEKYQELTDVPVGIDLLKHSLCGIVGGAGKQGAYQVAQIILAQICANICYTDVKIAIFYNENSENEREKWEFARWVPHIWNQEKTMRYFATNREEAREVSNELAGIFRKRAEGAKENRPYYILFFAEPEWLEGELLEKYVYNNQPEYGVSTCLLVENYEDLPNCCGQVIQKDENFSGMYHVMDGLEKRKEICFDKVSLGKWKPFGKCIASLKVKEEQQNREIPKNLTFLEMYGVDRIEELPIAKWWRKQRTYDSMRVCIGKKSGDRLCFLDIHENYHGPHGLIAGTTGAGKSELIQTFLLSLALNFSPKDVSFLLIDYKGGVMSQHFSELPHLAGHISNLSESGVRRAMLSIQSEIKRRQQIFLKHGINHIHAYTRLKKNGKMNEELSHLCIIVDEFAELKKEEPDFLRELITVAQVGRSLGIHLILATQKPCGTIDENIWSNSHFRICLRVQEEKDSVEVLKKTDAALLTQAGQGYLQVGNDEVFEPFQTGWSGAVYGEEKMATKVKLLTGTGKEVWNINGERKCIKENEQNKTELVALVEYIKKVADKEKIGKSRKLWLPLLPKTILLETVEQLQRKWEEKTVDQFHTEIVQRLEKQTNDLKIQPQEKKIGKKGLIAIAGLCDDPEEQRQMPFVANFTKDGHCCVIGTVSSGKSSVLQSMVWSLLRNYDADSLHLYLLDFGGGMLAVFENAPQVGGVLWEQETERLEKFLYFLQKTIKERKEQLAGVNYVQYIQNEEKPLPAIVVVLDNMAAFREVTEDVYTDLLSSFLREGAAYGIYFVFAANGFGVYDIPGRMQDFFKIRIALGLGDKYKYMEVLNISEFPFLFPKRKKGSGLVVVENRPLELQIALAGGEGEHERGEMLKRWCDRECINWKGKTARKIPEIPENFYLKQFAAQNDYKEVIATGQNLPIGYHRMEVEVLSVSFREHDCFLIGGTKGSGRRNVAKVLMYAARRAGANVFVFGTKEQSLKVFAEKQSVSYKDQKKEWYDCLVETVKKYKTRKEGLKEPLRQKDMENDLLQKQCKTDGMVIQENAVNGISEIQRTSFRIFIIEDMYDFMKQMYEEKNSIQLLEKVIEQASQNNIYWIGICNTKEIRHCKAYPAFVKMTRKKTGVYLGGTLSEQSLFDCENVTFKEEQRNYSTGSGYAFLDSKKSVPVPIVIPFVEQ